MSRRQYLITSDQAKAAAQRAITGLTFDKPFVVEIKPHRKKRTLAQNRLMHRWFNCIAKHWTEVTGQYHPADRFKLMLKRQFLGFVVTELPNGEISKDVKHTADCNTKELTEFLEQIEAWAVMELELLLPRPEDEYYLAMGMKR